jgi:hypothetical protein
VNRCILDQRQLQVAGYQFAGDVVTGRTKPSRYKNSLGPGENVSQRALNGIAIGNCTLFVNAKPKLKNLPRNKNKMSIEHVTEQNLRSGIDDDCFQRACLLVVSSELETSLFFSLKEQ